MSRPRVAIVQRYVARYRRHFYVGLVDELDRAGIDVVVVAGTPAGSHASRRDTAGEASWLRSAEARHVTLGPVNVPPFYGKPIHWRDCDGVIFTLRGNSVDLNTELLKKQFTGRRIGTWGHIKSYVKDGNALDLAIERWQMKRSDHVFAYTPAGAEFAIDTGVRRERVTAVVNSTDVEETLALADSLSSWDLTYFCNENGLVSGKTFGYIGGIDSVKRIDVLADALDFLWASDPEIKLVVGGRGEHEYLLSKAVARGQVVMVGYAGPTEKALISRVSEAILNPGRIGLLAVECMALGLPILTTEWRYHGPEYEYLEEGTHVRRSSDGASGFADLVLDQVANGPRHRPSGRLAYPTVTAMARNFANGVIAMMA